MFFGFVIVPSAIFALCGAAIGAGTFKSQQWGVSAALAMVGGGAVAALSLVLFILGWAVFEVTAAERPDAWLFVGMIFYLMALWGSIRLVPVILVGVFSGWLLHLLKLKLWSDPDKLY
jgi:hypothetical protein